MSKNSWSLDEELEDFYEDEDGQLDALDSGVPAPLEPQDKNVMKAERHRAKILKQRRERGLQ